MMVQASLHMGKSISMCGWAVLLGHKQISHFISYFLLIYLPMVITFICHSAIPKNPASYPFLMATILRGTPWPLHGHRGPFF